MSSCAGKVGFQGGNIARVFTGITTAQGISPRSIKLQWNDYPGATRYYVYSSESNNPIHESAFSTYVFQPSNPDPDKKYLYSVSAQDPLTGLEEGDRTNYTEVKLLPNHNFKLNGTVAPSGNNSILVTWPSRPGVTYKVYVAERIPTGETKYNFEAASKSVDGQGSVVIDQLLEGREYCSIVVASYTDEYNDAPDGVLFPGDITTFLNDPTKGYLKGPSGNFSDGKIAASQHCARTNSLFNSGAYTVTVNQGNLSSKPIFYANDPTDTFEDGQSTKVQFDIYRMSSNGGTSTKVASYKGTGPIQVIEAMASGKYKFFAVATSLADTQGAQAVIEVKVGQKTVPVGESARNWVYVRSFAETEEPDQSTAYFPEKQQSGYGSQEAGQSVASGDFNCDGKNDVAFGVPYASQYGSEDHLPSKQGRVVIYYDLKEGSDPETATRKQIITFDVSREYSKSIARNLMLGTKLFVGNFNKDNQSTNQNQDADPQLKSKFRCDDLVIASGQGPIFVLYGKRDVGNVLGGLNYTNETTYDINPPGSCDSSNNVCSPGLYYVGSTAGTNATRLGRAFTAGDYNGDGFLDLAVSTTNQGIWVFRGSIYGLMAPKSYNSNNQFVNTGDGQYVGYPYIPNTSNINTTSVQTPSVNTLGWGGTGFGASLGTFHNAYYDVRTKRIRSVLLIGNPSAANGGRVHACIPTSGTLVTPLSFDEDTLSTGNFRWDCTRSLTPPAAPNATTGFGSQIASIENALRYQPSDFICNEFGDGFGNCNDTTTNLGFPGAFAVSDPTHATDQKVFVYYGVNSPQGAQADRAAYGVARNNLLINLFRSVNGTSNVPLYADGQAINPMAVKTGTDQPCESVNNGASERCHIQKIKHPANYNCGFGVSMSFVPGSVLSDSTVAKDSILAVACPYRSISSSDGNTYTNVGLVQLFYQNSYNNSNLITVNGVDRASDGFSNSLTISLDYLGELKNDIRFGLGGIAGGPSFATDDLLDYSSNSDIFVGSPGFSKKKTVNNVPVSIVNNGAVFSFFSHGGTFRRYPLGENGPNPSLWHEFSQSYSQESDYKFHQAVSTGDLDVDGNGDVAVRINRGSKNSWRFYFSNNNSVGFDRNQYQNFSVQGDETAGMRFVPAGKVGQGQFPFFFITGSQSSYLFASGVGGIIQGQPAPFALPLLLKNPGGNSPRYPNNQVGYLSFGDSSFFNTEAVGDPTSTLRPNASFAHGDFNGDGYEDFAMAMNINTPFADVNNNFTPIGTAYGAGRVLVWYGGGDNGFQMVPDTNGGFPLSSDYFTGLSASQAVSINNVNNNPACTLTGTNCKIQMIMEPNTTNFGETILSVPMGKCKVNNKDTPVHGLLVYTRHPVVTNQVASSIYIYKPKCLSEMQINQNTDLSGLFADTASADIRILPRPSSNNSTKFGYSMTVVEGVMGNGSTTKAHLVISDETNRRLYFYPRNGSSDLDLGSQGSILFAGTFNADWTTQNQSIGLREVNYSSSLMLQNKSGAALTGAAVLFARSMGPVGDLNGDGYQDLAVAIPKLTRKESSFSESVDEQGGLLVLYGSQTGFQTHDSDSTLYEPERNSACYLKSATNSICKPGLVFLPQITNSLRKGEAELIYLPQDSFVKLGNNINEGLGTVLIGTPSKDTKETDETKRILNAGGFHALP